MIQRKKGKKKKPPRKKLKKKKKNDAAVVVELRMNYLLFPNFYYFYNELYYALTSFSDFRAISFVFLGYIHTITTWGKSKIP